MCELLGISLNTPYKPDSYIKKFLLRGENYNYGWGLAFYPDETAQIIKESEKADKVALDLFFSYLEKFKSKIFLGQLRNSTIGTKSRKNTHPFYRELNGKEYVFAHNGTMYNFNKLELTKFKPLGSTDSEHIFCYLLENIALRNIQKWENEDFRWLAEKLRDLNKYGSLNCLLSDGEYLFAYKSIIREENLYFNSIKFKNRGETTLDEYGDDGNIDSLISRQLGITVATRKLNHNRWYQLKKGELIVLKGGKVVYSNLMTINI